MNLRELEYLVAVDEELPVRENNHHEHTVPLLGVVEIMFPEYGGRPGVDIGPAVSDEDNLYLAGGLSFGVLDCRRQLLLFFGGQKFLGIRRPFHGDVSGSFIRPIDTKSENSDPNIICKMLYTTIMPGWSNRVSR